MTTVTIPKHLAGKELILVPKAEFEALQERANFALPKKYREVRMTKAQKKAFERAERNFAQGKSLTLNEFKQKLGLTR